VLTIADKAAGVHRPLAARTAAPKLGIVHTEPSAWRVRNRRNTPVAQPLRQAGHGDAEIASRSLANPRDTGGPAQAPDDRARKRQRLNKVSALGHEGTPGRPRAYGPQGRIEIGPWVGDATTSGPCSGTWQVVCSAVWPRKEQPVDRKHQQGA